jgi:hypothetical protein
MRCTQIVEAGAYVLGALPPAERAAYERHLPGCLTCRDEVSDLAGLPGLLGRLDSGTAASIGRTESSPPALLDTVLVRAGNERRRSRQRQRWQRSGALLAAACLAAVVGFGVATMHHAPRPRPVVAAMHPVSGSVPVTATVGYTANDAGGTQLTMSCVYLEATGPDSDKGSKWHLALVVFPRGSATGTTVSAWAAAPDDDFSFTWQLVLSPGQIGRIELQREGVPLLVYQAT